MPGETGTSVGIITLDLRILNTLQQQFNGIAAGVQKSAQDSFAKVGENASSAIQAPLKQAASNLSNAFSSRLIGLRRSLDSAFQPAASSAQLLSDKVVNLNEQYDNTRAKLAKMQAEFDQLPEHSKAWNELGEKITRTESRIISLQSALESAYDKMDAPARRAQAIAERAAEAQQKAAERLAAAQKAAAERAAAAQQKAAERTATKVSAAFRSASEQVTAATGTGISKAGVLFAGAEKSIGSRADRVKRRIERAFRSVFLMAGVYSVFRGARSLMEQLTAQDAQFSASLNVVKANLSAAFMPIYQTIQPALNSLMSWLASASNAIASFMSSLFGKTYSESLAAAKKLQQAQAASKSGSASGSGRSVAGFDEIHVIQKKDESGSGTTGVDFDAINSQGDAAAAGIGEKFRAAFAKINEALAPTKAALAGLGDEFKRLGGFAWGGLKDFYKSFLVPVGKWTLGVGLPGFIAAMRDGMSKISWEKTNTALHNLWGALSPFAQNVGGGLLWFWQNVLVPLGTWTMNEVVPAFLGILSGAIKILNNSINALKPLGQWLWDNFLQPLAQWTGGVITDVLKGIGYGLDRVGSWIGNNKDAVQAMTGIVAGFCAAWKTTNLLEWVINAGGIPGILKKITDGLNACTLAKIGDRIETLKIIGLYAKDFVVSMAKGTAEIAKQIAKWVAMKAAKAADVIATGAQTVATNLASAAQAALNFVMSLNPIALVVIAIAALVAAFIILWNNCEGFRNFWIGLWDGIKSVATAVGDWFSGPFVDFFRSAWNWIQSVFSGVGDWFGSVFSAAADAVQWAFSGVKDFFSGIWDGITGGLKSAVNGIIWGLNQMISGLNRIHINIPDWLGGGTFGIHIGSIPYLAKGGIVEQPTLSMIGEAGREAVVPLDRNTGGLQEIASRVAGMLGGAGGMDYQKLYDAIVRALRDSPLGVTLYSINYDLLAKGVLKALKEYGGDLNIPQLA